MKIKVFRKNDADPGPDVIQRGSEFTPMSRRDIKILLESAERIEAAPDSNGGTVEIWESDT